MAPALAFVTGVLVGLGVGAGVLVLVLWSDARRAARAVASSTAERARRNVGGYQPKRSDDTRPINPPPRKP